MVTAFSVSSSQACSRLLKNRFERGTIPSGRNKFGGQSLAKTAPGAVMESAVA
jgi:hypothetical protein